MNRIGSSGSTLGDYLSLNMREDKNKPNKKGRALACPVSQQTSKRLEIPDRVNESPLKTRTASTVDPLKASLPPVAMHSSESLIQLPGSTDKHVCIVRPSAREARSHEVENSDLEVKTGTFSSPSDVPLFDNNGLRKPKSKALSNKKTSSSPTKVSHEQDLCETNHSDLKLDKYWWLPNIKTKDPEHKQCVLDILRKKEKLAKEILKSNKGQSVEDLFGRGAFVIPSIGEKGYVQLLGVTAEDLLKWKLEEVFLVFTETDQKDKPVWYENTFPLVSPVEYPFLENERKLVALNKELRTGDEPLRKKIIPLLALF